MKPVTLAELKPGDFFGEMAAASIAEHAATSATAIGDTVLHRLSSDDFQRFLLEHPDAAIDVNTRAWCTAASNEFACFAKGHAQYQ